VVAVEELEMIFQPNQKAPLRFSIFYFHPGDLQSSMVLRLAGT
jgi:hypothetical protein